MLPGRTHAEPDSPTVASSDESSVAPRLKGCGEPVEGPLGTNVTLPTVDSAGDVVAPAGCIGGCQEDAGPPITS